MHKRRSMLCSIYKLSPLILHHLFKTRSSVRNTMKNLTIRRKNYICIEYNECARSGGQTSCADIAQWATEMFQLSATPNKSTICATTMSMLTTFDADSNRSRLRRDKDDALEKALFQWVVQCQNTRVHVNVQMFRHKVIPLREVMNEKLSTEEQCNMRFSNSWVFSFQKQWV